MTIRIRGENEKLSRNEALYAVNWFLIELLGNVIANNVQVTISFRPKLEGWMVRFNKKKGKTVRRWEKWKGELLSYTPRNFLLRCDHNYSRRTQLYILAHECAHIEQYATGKLHDYADNVRIRWKSRVIHEDDIEYDDHPWEIDARAKERALVAKYKEHLKQVKLEFN